MIVSIDPAVLQGNVAAPPSKSLSQRYFAAALLHPHQTTLSGTGRSGDERAARGLVSALGGRVEERADVLSIQGADRINPTSSILDPGESGLATRLFLPIAATSGHPLLISGHGSLPNRSMEALAEALTAFGVSVQSTNGRLPIRISGTLQARDATIDGRSGSQVLSGLLFAIGATTTHTVCITVDRLTSRPYIDLTLGVLRKFGYKVEHEDYSTFRISPRVIPPEDLAYTVEGDWSSAAALIGAAFLSGGHLRIAGLHQTSLQGDRAILDILCHGLQFEGSVLIADGSAPRRPFRADLTHTPDLFPTLAVIAAACDGESTLHGLHRLHGKESDRASGIQALLDALGRSWEVRADALHVRGNSGRFRSFTIDAFNDHRMVMAAAAAALRAEGRGTITAAEAVNKSYPGFFSVLRSLGAPVHQYPPS